MCCPGVCGLAVSGTWSGNYVRMTCFEKRSWRSSESGRTKSTASTDAIRRLFSHKFYARHTSAAADRPIDAPKAPWTKPFSFCMVTRCKNSTMVYQGTFESSLQIAGGAGTSKCVHTDRNTFAAAPARSASSFAFFSFVTWASALDQFSKSSVPTAGRPTGILQNPMLATAPTICWNMLKSAVTGREGAGNLGQHGMRYRCRADDRGIIFLVLFLEMFFQKLALCSPRRKPFGLLLQA